jgi:hypothetical protein
MSSSAHSLNLFPNSNGCSRQRKKEQCVGQRTDAMTACSYILRRISVLRFLSGECLIRHALCVIAAAEAAVSPGALPVRPVRAFDPNQRI